MRSFDRRTFLTAAGGALASFAGCSGPRSMYAGSERVTIEVGEYVDFAFELPSPATVKYAVEVVEGGSIDVVVTSRSSFRDLQEGRLDRYSGGASHFDVRDVTVVTELMHGEWVFLLDNSNLTTAADGTSDRKAVVDFEYDISRYIPYGSSREP